MEISEYFQVEFAKFLNTVHTDYPSTRSFGCAITVGYDRCMARMRDTAQYDPYKRCKMPIYVPLNSTEDQRSSVCFCKTHAKKCTNGRVDEKVGEDSKLYAYYMKKNPDFEQFNEENIVRNGTYCEFGTSDFETVLRKIEKQNVKKQRIEVMDCSDQLEHRLRTLSIADMPSSISKEGTDEERASEWKSYLKRKYKWQLTIREGDQLYQHLLSIMRPGYTPTIQSSVKKVAEKIEKPAKIVKEEEKITEVVSTVPKKIQSISAEDMNEYLETGDIQSIRVTVAGHRYDFYMLPNHTGKDEEANPFLLYGQYKKDKSYHNCGYAREWIDSADEVPDRFKNSQQYVLEPDSRLHVLEIDIHTKGAMISPISKGTYREYQYDEDTDDLVSTGIIQRFE